MSEPFGFVVAVGLGQVLDGFVAHTLETFSPATAEYMIFCLWTYNLVPLMSIHKTRKYKHSRVIFSMLMLSVIH